MNLRTTRIAVRALKSLSRYPLRSFLLSLSAALGVAGVICPINYGSGGAQQLLSQIRRMGSNVLLIKPAASRAVAGRVRTGAAVTTLVERDYAALRRDAGLIGRSSAVVSGSFWVKAGDLSKNTVVVGCEPDFFPIKDWPVQSGAVFDVKQNRSLERVALLGYTVAVELFGSEPAIGRRLLINRMPFTVIGVLQERGQGLDTANEDSQIYVPINSAMRRLLNSDHFDAILLQVDSIGIMDAAATKAQTLLHQLHHVGTGRSDDFQILNQKALVDAQHIAAGRLRFYVRSIGSGALVISGMGILGITWISIKERSREIGVRRALGANPSDVFVQFAVENGAVTSLGCIAGLAVTRPISQAIAALNDLPFTYDFRVAQAATIVALALSALCTMLPSRKAATLDPSVALRYE